MLKSSTTRPTVRKKQYKASGISVGSLMAGRFRTSGLRRSGHCEPVMKRLESMERHSDSTSLGSMPGDRPGLGRQEVGSSPSSPGKSMMKSSSKGTSRRMLPANGSSLKSLLTRSTGARSNRLIAEERFGKYRKCLQPANDPNQFERKLSWNETEKKWGRCASDFTYLSLTAVRSPTSP